MQTHHRKDFLNTETSDALETHVREMRRQKTFKFTAVYAFCFLKDTPATSSKGLCDHAQR